MSYYRYPRTVLVENFKHNPHIGLFQMEHLPTIMKLIDESSDPIINTSSPFLGYFLWPYWSLQTAQTPHKGTQTHSYQGCQDQGPKKTRDVGCNTERDPAIELGDQIIKQQESQWQKV